MKEWKAAEKEAQKMPRDGAISVNMVTGEASHVSDRAPEQDYSPSGDSTALARTALHHLDDRRVRKSQKKKRRNRRKAYREGTAANSRPSSRLQFTEEERAAPELQQAIRKSDKAADKLDAVRAAVPEKQPSLHQPVNPLARPLQEIGHAAHAKVHEVEQEIGGVRMLCIKRHCGRIRSLRPATSFPGCGRKRSCKSNMPPHTGRRIAPGTRRQRRRRQRKAQRKARTRRRRPESLFPNTKRRF